MSFFPGADLADDSPYMSPSNGFLRLSPSPRLPQHHQQGDMEPPTVPHGLPDSHTPSWHAPVPQGLGLIDLPVTTETSHDLMSTISSAPYYQTATLFAWPSELSSPQPPAARPQPARKDSVNDQSCDPFSTLLPGPLYEHHRRASLSVAGNEPSPGRSEYSRSSYPSAVSSPYAHSDFYVHSVDSPQIKIEYPPIPQIHFLSEENQFQHQPVVVNPGDLMNIDQKSIEERVRTCLGSSSSSDNGDCKPPIQQSVLRRPHSFGDFGALTRNGLVKRTYTKPENANFRCDQCGRGFQRGYNLRSHLSNVHNRHRARQHPCEYDGCTNTFVRRTDLTRHEESVCICTLVQHLVSNRL